MCHNSHHILFDDCYQALGVFGLCQLHSFVDYLRSRMTKNDFDLLFHSMVIATASITAVVGGALTLTGMV
jgi:dolichyl-diphosphooligosaccharide--protein glycosyltransferase